MGAILSCGFGMFVVFSEDDGECCPNGGDASAQCQPGSRSVTGPGNNSGPSVPCRPQAAPPSSPPPSPPPPLQLPWLPAWLSWLPTSTAPAAPVPALAATKAQIQIGGHHHHPLGCMFSPELDGAGVLKVIKEVLCAPGFVSGPAEGDRLVRSVGSGRVDISTMSRLLRWLRGERAARELGSRGLRFVGPETEDVLRPITTGLGMARLTKEVIACGYPAGTQFVVCSSSSYDACSGVISGVLTAIAPSDATTSNITSERPSETGSNSSLSVYETALASSGGGGRRCGGRSKQGGSVASTPSPHSGQGAAWTPTASSFSPPSHSCPCSLSGATGKGRAAGKPAIAPGSAMPSARASSSTKSISGKGITTTGGGGGGGDGGSDPSQYLGRRTPYPSRRMCTPFRTGGGGGGGGGSSTSSKNYSRSDVVAHLFDDIPTHCRAGYVDAGGGGLSKMEVGDWAKIYGECNGPLLAAWVLPGGDASKPAE